MLDCPLQRLVGPSLRSRLSVMPAVVVTGARQTGKSTLVQELMPGPRRYFSFDDLDVVDAARRDPEVLVGGSEPVTLDEVQREPGVLSAVKRAIDRERTPGRFLLTGSANLLLMRRVSESLAGRASYLLLSPMTRREQRGRGRGGIWSELLDADERHWSEIVAMQPEEPEDWKELAVRGGFPVPALELGTPDQRAIWFGGYVTTYLERDLQNLSAVSALPDFRRLMRAVCLRLGGLVNKTELGRDVALPQTTVHRYLNLLETSLLLVRVPAYAVNRTKRLIKSPKLYCADIGLALHLAQVAPNGAHLENLVLADLLAWRATRTDHAEVCYWRTTAGEEVDFVVEVGGRLLPIEVKTTQRPTLRDIRHLRSFRAEYPEAARPGLLLHTGTAVEWLAPDVLAAPWWRIL
ncbi:MAG: ATP-binding protein [bacterium]|nr:ATP-binding protein [bacterium]